MTASFFRLAPSSRRTKRIVIVLAALYAVYALVAAVLGPVLVRRILPQKMAAQLHRSVTVGRVRVNPFTLAVTVDSLRVADRDGSTLLSLDVAYVNASLMSVVRRELDFDEIRFEQPYAHFVMRRDGTMNVSDIIDSMNAEAKRHPSPGPPPVFAVSGLHIINARVEIADSEPSRPFSTTAGPWRIDLASFSTRRDNTGQYSFQGRMVTGETFAWIGTFAMDPVRSTGQFAFDGVKLSTYAAFYEHDFGFTAVNGTIGMRAEYSLDLTPRANVMRVQEGNAHARDLALVERGHADTALVLDRVEITGIEADAVTNVARVESIAATGADVRVVRSRDSTINVLRMLLPPKEAGAPAAAPAPSAPPAKPWRWTIGHVAADSSTMSVVDSVARRPAHFAMSGIRVTLDSVASDSAQRSRVQADLLWEKTGNVSAGGTVAIWHRSGDITYAAKDLSVAPFDAYVGPSPNLLNSDGAASSDGKIHFEWADTLHPELRFAGNVRVDHFATVDATRKEAFFKFRSLQIASIDYAMRQPRLSIKSIELDGPLAEIGILPDGTPVLYTIFPRPGEDSALAAQDSAAARAARGDTLPHDSTATPPASAANSAPSPPAPTKKVKGGKNATVTPEMRTSIGYVKVTNGTINVTDRSMKPPIKLSIDKIRALTGRLTSESLGVGTLDMVAAIDSIAPIRVAGRFNPLSSKEGSDLTFDLQGMEMVPMGPYFGKYLGYGISTGKLKIGMQYRVVARQLKSENKFILDGFEWGDASNSPTATKLPVKLAFSVMRDRNGQIVFDVPVEGNLDDPAFRYGRVVLRAIVNVFVKLATSPFKLLSSAFGGSANADLSYADFEPGSSALEGAATAKLGALAKALYERPALKLQIAGSMDTASDRDGIRKARLDARLRIVKWNALKAQGAKDLPPPDSLLLADANRPLWIAKEFETTFPNDTAVIRTKGKQGALPYPADVMEQKLMATIQVGPDELQLLAAARAKACLDYLLTVPTNKIEPERVLLLGGAPKTAGAKALFALQ